MFISQKDRLFPLPDYDLTEEKVKVVITGKILDLNYARKLAQMPNLDLNTIISLDRVQKKQLISDREFKKLKRQGLIEGRRPNIYISYEVAGATKQESDYMKLRGAEDSFCKSQIVEYLKKYKSGAKQDFENMLIEKLSDALSPSQKRNKITNMLQSLRRSGEIKVGPNKKWLLNNTQPKSKNSTSKRKR